MNQLEKKTVKSTGLFAHDRLDSLLVLVAVIQFVVLIFGIVSFGIVPWWVTLLVGAKSVFLVCTNFQCIAHNFLHNQFFRSKRLNLLFSLFNSTLIGGSQTLYRFHHLHHHRHNNDLPDPNTGKAKDFTSTWQHGVPPIREENFLTYSLFGYFRTDFRFLYATAKQKQVSQQVVWEFATFAAMMVALLLVNPLGVVCFYSSVWLLGNIASAAENYLEHYGATPGNRRTDSVSSYGWLYNVIWFNNGFHQEHHFKPQIHWTRIREVKDALPPENERRVVRGAHWFNFGPRQPLNN